VYALPHTLAAGRVKQPGELCTIEHVGQRFALLWRAQDVGRVTLEVLVLNAEAKKRVQRRDRLRLAGWAGRRVASTARNRRRSTMRTSTRARMPAALRKLQAGSDVALISFARRVRQATLDSAVNREVRQDIEQGVSDLWDTQNTDLTPNAGCSCESENPAVQLVYTRADESPSAQSALGESPSSVPTWRLTDPLRKTPTPAGVFY
jgi:hypothetical protein